MLHLLAQYAEDRDLTAKPGYAAVDVAFVIDVSSTGHVTVERLLTPESKKGRRMRGCPQLSLGELKAIGSGARHFLVDSLDVVANLTKNEQTEPTDKQQAKHDYFVSQLGDPGAVEAEPLLAVAAKSLADEDQLSKIVELLRAEKAKPTDKATFRVDGALLVGRTTWHDWWDRFRESIAAGKTKGKKPTVEMRCLLTGELAEPAATHPKVRGLADVGGQSSGDVLASFKQGAFQHYGLSQSANAAMSEEAAKLYSTALTHAIREQSLRLGESKVVYWYTGLEEIPERERPNPFAAIFSKTAESDADASKTRPKQPPKKSVETAKQKRQRLADMAESSARTLLDRVREGGYAKALSRGRYVALVLAANSGRVVIRRVVEGRFQEIVEAHDAWFADLAITDRSGERLAPPPKFAAVLGALVRDFGDLTGPMEESLWLSAIDANRPIPPLAAKAALDRFRIAVIKDETILHAQVGLLRAYLNRSRRVPDQRDPDQRDPQQSSTQASAPMPETLDTSGDQPAAYQYGRVLALLADIQRAALGDVGAGLTQRYFSAASATPALVIGRLVRLAQTGHLPKLDPKLKNWFEDRLAEAWAPLATESVQSTPLSLEDQTLFALGYYHQRADRSKRTSSGSKSETAAESDAPSH